MFIPYIQLYNQKTQIPYTKKYHSILEALEGHSIKVNFQCREGYCGICKTLLIHGSIQYLKEPLASIKNFEILICCCIPINNIYIKP